MNFSPYGDVFRSKDWTVDVVQLKAARDFIERHHYAKGSSRTCVFAHGLFDGIGDLCGVVLWLPPTKNCCISVNRNEWTRVLSLSRMAIVPGVPKNACSFLLARSCDLIRKDGRFNSLVTFADESQSHRGHVYRACGWTYIGRTSKTERWIEPASGRQVAQQSTKTRTKSEMLALGYVSQGYFFKRKFVKYLTKSLELEHCTL